MRLIKKGAEANLYLSDFQGQKVLIKKRVEKKYRLTVLDHKIRSYRTVHEAQLIHNAKKAGVPTPIIFLVDRKKFTITMEYIAGERLKELFFKISNRKCCKYSKLLGLQVGLLHQKGIIHGDLTTSNMILTFDDKLYFLDFGLGYYSNSIEDKGNDLHLLKRALNSTHYLIVNQCFENIIKGYRLVSEGETDQVLLKLKEIEHRGRYFAERR